MGRHKTALLEFFLVEDNLFTFVVRPDMPEFGINDKEPLVFEAQLGEAEVAAAPSSGASGDDEGRSRGGRAAGKRGGSEEGKGRT